MSIWSAGTNDLPKKKDAYATLTVRRYHAGGINAAMMDGSVRTVPDVIDLTVWQAISTRAGGEVQPLGF